MEKPIEFKRVGGDVKQVVESMALFEREGFGREKELGFITKEGGRSIIISKSTKGRATMGRRDGFGSGSKLAQNIAPLGGTSLRTHHKSQICSKWNNSELHPFRDILFQPFTQKSNKSQITLLK